jgi:ABC-2 type transport system permease protein
MSLLRQGSEDQAPGAGPGLRSSARREAGFSATRVLAVLVKEFKQLTRDRITYAMILVLPVVQLLLFGYAINSEPRHLPTAVLIQEDSVFARSITAALKNSLYFEFTAQARTPAELDEMLRRGDVQFAITIPGDFTRRVARGDQPQILVEADAADPSATGSAVAALAALPNEALVHDLTGALAPKAAAKPPFEVVVHRRYNPEAITAFNIVPGLLGVILSMTLVMMTALSVTRETERGTMESLLATPLEPIEVMIGKLAPYVLVGLIQTVIILLLAKLLFAIPMVGGWLGLVSAIGLFITGSLALGFLISTVARSQLQAMQMSFFYILPSILLSGFMFPFRGMPAWAQWLGEVIPVTHFLRVVRGALLKGQGLGDMWRELAALTAFVCVVTALAMARYRRTLD